MNTNPASNKKLKGKDFINIGIFTVIYLVLFMIAIMVMSLTVYTLPFGVALGSFLGAPVYMLLRSKTHGTGAILLFGALFGLVLFSMGSGWPILLSVITGALLAEALTFGGTSRSLKREISGYVVLMLATAVGSYMPFLFMKEYYLKIAEGNGIDGKYMIDLINFINGPYLLFSLAVTLAVSVSGSVFARFVMKKHLIKAGLIKEMTE